ncbi:Hypothetical protein NTJ_11872 [Nesidiocoris tenuis]|uniref:DRBM domain-containing protein n=1 Tax=Nesidiocoris tenuis TaxID=355587 RepID=A0ABN7B3Q4_9HEMI|nr:Hypothetical protein NTJ_11872 [Nesidiocoris tenuis]
MENPPIDGVSNKRKADEDQSEQDECESPKKMKNGDSQQPETPKTKNSAAIFHENCQKYCVEPKIEYIEKVEYDGESKFSSWTCQISLEGSIVGSAWAKHKKEAKEAACYISLAKFEQMTPKKAQTSPTVATSSIVQLNEICQKISRTSVLVSFSPHKPDGCVESSTAGLFKCEVSLPEHEYITGTGVANTKKMAKAIACSEAISKIELLKTKPEKDLSITERSLLSQLALCSSTAKSKNDNSTSLQNVAVADPTSLIYSQLLFLEKDGTFRSLKQRDPFGCVIRLCNLAKQPAVDPIFTLDTHLYFCTLTLASWTASGTASTKKQAKYAASLRLLDKVLLHPNGNCESANGNS